MYAPELYCLTFSAEPASGLGQYSTADQPWMAHGGNTMGPFKWSHIYIRWDVLSRELQNEPCRKTFKLEYLEIFIKGGPEPSNFEDLCLVNVSVKSFSKLCFGTIKIQPELEYWKTILEDFTSEFQRAKAWEHNFGRVPSISFIFTGSKMARICKVIYYQYFAYTM